MSVLTPQLKLTLFSLLYKGAQHKMPPEQLFYTLSQKGPENLKKHCASAAILIKKRHSFPVAGENAGLFTKIEARGLRSAIEKDCLLQALNTFVNYYKVRLNYKSHFTLLWPYFLLLMVAIILAPIPDFYSGSINIIQFLLLTVLPLGALIVVMIVYNDPRKLIDNNLSKSFDVPQMLMKLPTIGPRHIEHEMTYFLESVGILKQCGYSYRQAVENSVQEVINPQIQTSLGIILVRMQRRDTFADALKACEYFPEKYILPLEKAQAANVLAKTLIRFGTTHMLKGEQKIKQEIKLPAILMSITAFVVITFACLKFYTFFSA